ncbi:MAG: hypothetical protein LUM44_04025 [Pyrinomonadaceae bacterium]|nr:hypothetical protein [Pyrinomonadaceae bacterium]
MESLKIPEQTDAAAENIKYAKAFVEFQYAEIKDFSKQFLTVVAGVLAVTVTFSEKIVNFATASSVQRFLLMAVWCGCIIAFTLGGLAIVTIYDAGVVAKETELDGKMRTYPELRLRSHRLLIAGGITFVLSLALLVVTGLIKAF